MDETIKKADVITKAIETYIAKVKSIAVKARVDDDDMEKVINCRKKLIEDKFQLLKDHRNDYKEILIRHFYDMSHMMSKNEGVWLSNGRVKTLLWIFLPCLLYTVISIIYFIISNIGK